MSEQPRVVIAHDFAEVYGGAERIIAEVAAHYPEAPFWAIAGRRSVAERMGVADRFHTLLPERRWLLRHYRWGAPLYPALVRTRRLPAADVLITSSYAFAHGLRTVNDAPQVCYCYAPPHFVWSMTDEYGRRLPGGRLSTLAFQALAGAMRVVDRTAARRVTRYLTETDFTQRQIREFYGLDAEAIGAPVDCDLFHPGEGGHDDYFLFCGRLVDVSKRPSIVIDAFRSRPDLRLVIAGEGPDVEMLRARAGPNVEFRGHLDDDELVGLMQRCAAGIFPSIEDFGLVPVEVMACGRPVLAIADGGVARTVAPGITGEFFREQTAESVLAALRSFDPNAYDTAAIRRHALQWDRWRFRERVARTVDAVSRAGTACGVAAA